MEQLLDSVSNFSYDGAKLSVSEQLYIRSSKTKCHRANPTPMEQIFASRSNSDAQGATPTPTEQINRPPSKSSIRQIFFKITLMFIKNFGCDELIDLYFVIMKVRVKSF